MADNLNSSYPSDICLLLWAHAEQFWLSTQIVPVVRQLQCPGTIPEDQLGAALAYLEVLWLDAARRAAQTDGAYAQLDAATNGDRALNQRARTYCASIRELRSSVSLHVERLLASPAIAPTQPSAVTSTRGSEPIA
jgi:hypothetical protein